MVTMTTMRMVVVITTATMTMMTIIWEVGPEGGEQVDEDDLIGQIVAHHRRRHRSIVVPMVEIIESYKPPEGLYIYILATRTPRT